MTKPPSKKQGKGRRSHLSDEDEHLWAHTTSSLTPLEKKRLRVHPAVPETFERDARHDALEARIFAADHAEGSNEPPKVEAPLPMAQAYVPPLNTFDKKAARKLRQGHFEIEARIDLHGMRQQEAHTALRRFLFSCHGRALRWVLVITGKGTAQRRRDDDMSYGYGYGEERGVLKRNVPMWLGEPELRAIVVSYTSAAIQHGGEGALYVQLRNPERLAKR